MLTDDQLLALNVYEEAGAEIDDGKAAIVRIVKNRMKRKFFSDGTVAGTILRKDQFSWAWFGFETLHTGTEVHGLSHREYVRVAHTPEEAQEQAQNLWDMAPSSALEACSKIAQTVMTGDYPGVLYGMLTDDTVLYLNPAILTKLPDWAIPSARVCVIGHHQFYRSVPVPVEGAIA